LRPDDTLHSMTEPAPSDTEAARARFANMLLADDPAGALLAAVADGFFDEWLPEIPALAMEQDPIHHHKDVLLHTAAVVANTPADLRVRMAAVLHDVGKPATRRFGPDGVTFYHHEAVGARISQQRLTKLGFEADFVEAVADLVALSGRFKGYQDGWTDSAVRRYARDAGPLLGDLNTLVRCDCTTRNPRKVQALHRHLDELEERIRELAVADAERRHRPALSGDQIMQLLDLPPGPLIGEALNVLKQAEADSGQLDDVQAGDILRAWWSRRSI
jgi:poly(A) polymerase